MEGKVAGQKTNNITYSKAIKKSNEYQITNLHKLLAFGVLEIKRKDNEKIRICGSKSVLAHIKSFL